MSVSARVYEQQRSPNPHTERERERRTQEAHVLLAANRLDELLRPRLVLVLQGLAQALPLALAGDEFLLAVEPVLLRELLDEAVLGAPSASTSVRRSENMRLTLSGLAVRKATSESALKRLRVAGAREIGTGCGVDAEEEEDEERDAVGEVGK